MCDHYVAPGQAHYCIDGNFGPQANVEGNLEVMAGAYAPGVNC